MTRIRRAATIAALVFCAAAGADAAAFLREPLSSLPAAPAAGLSLIDGRTAKTKTLLITAGEVPLPAAKGPADGWFVEFWLKPHAWNALSAGAVDICSVRAAATELVLRKRAGAAELELAAGGSAVCRYPIYGWVSQPWTAKTPRDAWHHVFLRCDGGQPALFIDGFTARSVRTVPVAGPISKVTLLGAPGTAFSGLYGADGGPSGAADIRRRYRSLYRNEPDLPANTVTVPRLARAPRIDGTLSPGEWDGAAAITGFVALRGKPGALTAEPITAWIGRDDAHLYLSIRTPYEGVLDAKRWNVWDMPLWGEESYEMFFHPPFTGTPDFCQLVGNPFGDQADLKMLNIKWDGRWDWKTSRPDGAWIAEFRAPFEGIKTPVPADGAVWTMNMVNSDANAGWCWTQRYNDSSSFGAMRFGADAFAVRPGEYSVDGKTARLPVVLRGGGRARTVLVGLQFYAPGGVLPDAETIKTVAVPVGASVDVLLETPLSSGEGRLAFFVREDGTDIAAQTVAFPAAPPAVRKGPRAAAPALSPAVPAAEAASPATPEQRAYARRWTAEELGETLLASARWKSEKAGVTEKVPEPWTPMRVAKGVVSCWGRTYDCGSTLLPRRISSDGEEVLAADPVFVIVSGKTTYRVSKADVRIEPAGDGSVNVRSSAAVGPFRIALDTTYEFDGMGRVEMTLDCPGAPAPVDGLALEIPLRADRSILYHMSSSASGHPPASDSGRVPPEGLRLDLFREIVWLGDNRRGLCWFAESMENWRIRDEKDIQAVTPLGKDVRVLRVKLCDRPFTPDRPLKIVFGLQATPTRPRPADFRTMSDSRSIGWCWFWGDGQYYPFHAEPARAKEHVEKNRAAGREVMPCSSTLFHGVYRFAQSLLGPVSNPGLMHRENMIFGREWRATTLPIEDDGLPERHTAPGDWYDKRFRPEGLTGFCVASGFQDYYLSNLRTLVRETGLAAIYLDQPMYDCSNARHGCGYVNYRGEWTPRVPLFAMRSMVKRMRAILDESPGRTIIKWHSSNQIIVPVVSFVDVFWDGENYGSGPAKVFEFYSSLLSDAKMQAQHTGRQFGFAADLLPEFERRYAPSPASERDMMGVFMVHDSTVYAAHAEHTEVIKSLQEKRLSFPLDRMETVYYWDAQDTVRVSPETVRFVLHTGGGRSLLVVFNRGDEPVEAAVRLKVSAPSGAATDVETGEALRFEKGTLTVPLLPRDLRMIELK